MNGKRLANCNDESVVGQGLNTEFKSWLHGNAPLAY
jgi:hypothetical protein